MPEQVAHFAQHLQVVAGALFDALRFEQFLVGLKVGHALFQLFFDIGNGFFEPVFPGQVMLGREDIDLLRLGEDFAGQRVELR